MPAIVGMAEFISCCLVTSAIAWLRRLRGAPLMYPDFGIRYVVPVVALILVVLLMSLGVHEQQRGEFHQDSSQPVVVMALCLGVVLVALVAWLVVEVRRFGAPWARAGASRRNRPRPNSRKANTPVP